MTKKIVRLFAGLVLILITNIASAADYGRFLCTNCSLPMNQGELNIFVTTVVNHHVNIWRSGDSFSICDGSICQNHISAGGTQVGRVWSYGMTYPDPKVNYKAEGQSVAIGGMILAGVTHSVDYGWLEQFLGSAFGVLDYTPDGYVIVEPLSCIGSPEVDDLIGACP